MARLSARGMVEVNARRGWFVVQPSLDEAREAFEARQALETGLLHGLSGPLPKAAIRQLKAHISREQAATADDPLAPLRAALSPLKSNPATDAAPATAGRRRPARKRLFSDLIPSTPKPTP